MATIIHLKNISTEQRDKLARDNEARLNSLTPEQQIEKLTVASMFRELQTLKWVKSSKDDDFIWLLSDNDFGGY